MSKICKKTSRNHCGSFKSKSPPSEAKKTTDSGMRNTAKKGEKGIRTKRTCDGLTPIPYCRVLESVGKSLCVV